MTSKAKQDYLVLARKYRPQKFEDLYGQDALVQTLQNAVESERLHHAYVLNGIRGTGKTTTARILAKVLNCENGPSTTWADDDPQCLAIEKGSHVDVLEFDAASYTGVDDIRELFEGVNYAPVQGRYKVYIIDEVHMLSKQAFNALLKTLEEPPAQVKFIFATTEVNKIPVTVLSRCQRFDLKRITADTLYQLFEKILGEEKVKFEETALHLIARAADGSARDGLSLLDQSIALSSGKKVSTDIVAHMLGQADRSKVYDLFDTLMSGDPQEMLNKLTDMYTGGHDPLLLVHDLLQLTHLVTRLKVVPDLAKSRDLSELEKTRAVEFSQKLNLENLSRSYQMLLTAAEEAKKSNRPFETVEMALIRIVHLAALPAIESIIAAQGTDGGKKLQGHPKQQPRPEVVLPEGLNKPHVAEKELPKQSISNGTFSDWRSLVAAIKKESHLLAIFLSQRVRPIHISGESLTLYIEEDGLKSDKEIVKELSDMLQKITSKKWQVILESEAHSETLEEENNRHSVERITVAQGHKEVKQILEAFPDAEVMRVVIEE